MGLKFNTSQSQGHSASYNDVTSTGNRVVSNRKTGSNKKNGSSINESNIIRSSLYSRNSVDSASKNSSFSYSIEGSKVIQFFGLMVFVFAFFTAYRILYDSSYSFSFSSLINGLNSIFNSNPFGLALNTINTLGGGFGTFIGIIVFLTTLPIACINYIIEIVVFILSGSILDFNTPILSFLGKLITLGASDGSSSFWDWIKWALSFNYVL